MKGQELWGCMGKVLRVVGGAQMGAENGAVASLPMVL
jgi:hypothetical protein